MEAEVKHCLKCRQHHASVEVIGTYEDARGRPRFRYVCPVKGEETSASGRPTASRDSGGTKPSKGDSKTPRKRRTEASVACKTTTVKLKAAPQVEVCPESAWPILEGFWRKLKEKGWRGGASVAAIMEADRVAAQVASGSGDCCNETTRDAGEDIAEIFGAFIIANRIGPEQWVNAYPAEAMAAFAASPAAFGRTVDGRSRGAAASAPSPSAGPSAGGGQPPSLEVLMGRDDTDGVPDTDFGAGLLEDANSAARVAGGASLGGRLGSRLGPYGAVGGAVVGGALGAFFPEAVDALEGVDSNQLDLALP